MISRVIVLASVIAGASCAPRTSYRVDTTQALYVAGTEAAVAAPFSGIIDTGSPYALRLDGGGSGLLTIPFAEISSLRYAPLSGSGRDWPARRANRATVGPGASVRVLMGQIS